jgi:3-phosphoshikimate 1-carboxyvinyltransferase
VQSVIRKGNVKGSVTVPSSKSILQRYMIAALLSKGETQLHAVSNCSDTISCLNAVRTLGAVVQEEENGILKIKGVGNEINPSAYEINCGESGFALRALSAVAALSDSEIQLSGTGSLMNRPVGFMEDVFTQLEVKCISKGGRLPLTLHGPVHFKNIVTDGSLSSQFLSGLLMIFPFAEEDHIIEVTSLKSREYIDLTMEVLKISELK